MATFKDDALKGVENFFVSYEKALEGAMKKAVTAGAKVAKANIVAGAPNKALAGKVKISRVYKTPSDRGINKKVYLSGYLPFSTPNRKSFSRRGGAGTTVYHTSKGVPASFIGILYEYGRSTAPFPKRPFLRKAMGDSKIGKAMEDAFEAEVGGIK